MGQECRSRSPDVSPITPTKRATPIILGGDRCGFVLSVDDQDANIDKAVGGKGQADVIFAGSLGVTGRGICLVSMCWLRSSRFARGRAEVDFPPPSSSYVLCKIGFFSCPWLG